jgi:putative transposase
MLEKAQKVADFAVKHKGTSKGITSKSVKEYGLPSAISNQILRKYGRGDIKEATNVNLIIPNSSKGKYKKKDGTGKVYSTIEYKNERVYIKPLKLYFRWNPGIKFEKINQVEINKDRYMIAITVKHNIVNQEYSSVLGIDLNCGVGRSVANCANLKNGEILNLGKQGPNIRKYYYKKRQKHSHQMKGAKEKRKMRDLDHKMSRTIVNYALKHKLKIVMEDLKGIRTGAKKGKGSKNVNRFVNSWSFYRLQTFIEYKAKECGIPFDKIKPQYTSQECSFCSVIGERKGEDFICKNKRCKGFKKKRHADKNAAFNIGKRSLLN